jgi:protein phosphatase 1G
MGSTTYRCMQYLMVMVSKIAASKIRIFVYFFFNFLQNKLTYYVAFYICLYIGGPEVAQFAKEKMPNIIRGNKHFKNGDYKIALCEAFHAIDQLLEQPQHQLAIGMTPNNNTNSATNSRNNNSVRKDDSSVFGSATSNQQTAKEAEAKRVMQQMMVMRRALQGGKVTAGGGEQGDRKVCTLNEHPVRCGCTAVVTLIVGNIIYVANAGDSRSVLCRKGGAVPLSFDHKPNDKEETDRIVGAGGFITSANGHFRVNGNLNLSRSLGDLKYKQNKTLPREQQMITAQPDLLTETLCPGDEFIIMACDGVWDVMSNQQAIDFVRVRLKQGKSPAQIAEEIFDYCIADDPKTTRGIGGDNMTCIIICIENLKF